MNTLTDFIKFDLYPIIFEVIPSIFPEHDFKKNRGNWQSKTYLNGSPHKNRRDKTVISKRAPGLILEQGGEVLSLCDYIMRRDNIVFIDAVKLLAKNVGLELPKGDFNIENYKSYKEKNTLLEEANNYFKHCLKTSSDSEELKSYLKSRGYSLEEVEVMEIGFISSQELLKKHLIFKGYSKKIIDDHIKFDKRIGSTYKLTIPYRSGGSIKGFKFRTIENLTPKYLNSTNLDKTGGFFNLLAIKGNKDLVIVEGELDSLSATVKGVENIVATGGSSINSNQVKDAIKRGAQKFTICFDNEPGKEEATNKNINTAIEVILKEGVNSVYIVTLPTSGDIKIDPDSFIRDHGIERFKTVIDEAVSFYEYRLNTTLIKFSEIENTKGALTYKDKDNLLEEVINTASKLDPICKDQYLKSFISLDPIREIGITEESLAIAVDKLTSTKEKEQQKRDFNSLLSKAKNLEEKGEVNKALDLLNAKVKEVKLKDKATEFNSLLLNTTEEELRSQLKNKPKNLLTSFRLGKDPMEVPQGAVTILTAPTSHGKTTFLINLALDIAKEYKDKQTYFFSYEEDSNSILLNALNVYMNEEISGNNRTTLRNYFSGHNNKNLSNKKDAFFEELINTQRLNINYTNYNSETLIEAIRYLHKNGNPGAIFIDYIQLLSLPQGKYKTYSRQEELKIICQDLKDVAVETGLPIILGAQFNRTVTNLLHLHSTKIGEAGDIERIANLIIGFWNNNFTPVGTEGELNSINKLNYPKDSIYIKVLKNRAGRVGAEEVLNFNGNTGKISNQELNFNEVEF